MPRGGNAIPPPPQAFFLTPYRDHISLELGAPSAIICLRCGAKPRDNRRGFQHSSDGTCQGNFVALTSTVISGVLLWPNGAGMPGGLTDRAMVSVW